MTADGWLFVAESHGTLVGTAGRPGGHCRCGCCSSPASPASPGSPAGGPIDRTSDRRDARRVRARCARGAVCTEDPVEREGGPQRFRRHHRRRGTVCARHRAMGRAHVGPLRASRAGPRRHRDRHPQRRHRFLPVSVQRGARSPPSPTVASEFARNGMGRVQARVDTRSLASERADACR